MVSAVALFSKVCCRLHWTSLIPVPPCSGTGELRQATERCAALEIEVREEVSNEMAELMKEAEARLREMYTKAADVSTPFLCVYVCVTLLRCRHKSVRHTIMILACNLIVQFPFCFGIKGF